MRHGLLLLFLSLALLARGADTEWTLLKYEGRDYLTFENLASFYGLKEAARVGGTVTLTGGQRSLRGANGSVDFYINNLKFVLSYPVIEREGHLCVSRMDLVKIIEPIMRPSRIKGAETVDTVILDPGHGGQDAGALSAYGNEKTYTLDVANRARLLLLAQGLKVYMTRSTDTFVPLEDRVQFANHYPNGLFISIHFNSGGNATGIETYTLAPRGVPSMMADGPRIGDLQECAGNACDAENIALATAAHACMVVHSRMYDRGIKRARFLVIRDVTIPGVLIEGGFLSSSIDARLIATPEYRQEMAASILQAVTSYRRAVGPKSTPAPQMVSRLPGETSAPAPATPN